MTEHNPQHSPGSGGGGENVHGVTWGHLGCDENFALTMVHLFCMGFPWWPNGKESPCSAGDAGDLSLVPGSGNSPEVGSGNPLQYSCLENSMDRGAWWATVHRVPKS